MQTARFRMYFCPLTNTRTNSKGQAVHKLPSSSRMHTVLFAQAAIMVTVNNQKRIVPDPITHLFSSKSPPIPGHDFTWLNPRNHLNIDYGAFSASGVRGIAPGSRMTLQGETCIGVPGRLRCQRTILRSRSVQGCCLGSRRPPESVPSVFPAGRDRPPPKHSA
jgi:hypothetical protein